MNRFAVDYVDASGKTRHKQLVADSVRGCEQLLAVDGCTLLAAKRLPDPQATRRDATAAGKRRSGGRTLPVAQLVELSAILSSLLDASLSIRDALLLLQGMARQRGLRDLCGRLLLRIDRGEAFARAAAMEGRGFPPLVLALIGIGERTGDLALSFRRIWSYAENRRKLASAIGSALAYPVLVLVVLVFGSVGLGVYALPKLRALFAGMGGSAAEELNAAMNQAAGRVLWAGVLAAAVLCSVLGLALLRRNGGRGRLLVDRILLALPLLGAFIRDSNTLDFTFSMEALVGAGIPVNEALGESCASLSNAAYAEAVGAVNEQVRKGESLSNAFRAQPRLPGQLALWMAVGERSGNIPAIFGQLHGFYETIVARWMARFLALVEPAVSLLVGLLIVMLIFTFVIPIFNAYGALL